MAQIMIKECMCKTVGELKTFIADLGDHMALQGLFDGEVIRCAVMQEAELIAGRFVPINGFERVLALESVDDDA